LVRSFVVSVLNEAIALAKLGPPIAAEAGPVATLRICAYIDQQKKQILDPRAFRSKSD